MQDDLVAQALDRLIAAEEVHKRSESALREAHAVAARMLSHIRPGNQGRLIYGEFVVRWEERHGSYPAPEDPAQRISVMLERIERLDPAAEATQP
jgi:hypothetical protein